MSRGWHHEETEFGHPCRHTVLIQVPSGEVAALGPFAARNVAIRVGEEIAEALVTGLPAEVAGGVSISVLPLVSGSHLTRYKVGLLDALTPVPEPEPHT